MGVIKDWRSQYPDEKDTTSNMPDLKNLRDETRVSHVHSLRNAIIEVEEEIGSQHDEPGSLRKRVADLEAGTGTDEKVKITASDTTPAVLDTKLSAASGLQKTTLNPGGNEVLRLTPIYGTLVNTICQGNDARLSDDRTPTAHATNHQDGGSDEISVAGLLGILAQPQNADKLSGRDIATASPTNEQVLTWNSSTSKWEPQTPETGADKEIEISVASTPGNYDSVTSIPENAYIKKCTVSVNSEYNGGATIEVKTNGSTPYNIQLISENNLGAIDHYVTEPLVKLSATQAGTARVVLAGSPTSGAAKVVIEYSTVMLS